MWLLLGSAIYLFIFWGGQGVSVQFRQWVRRGHHEYTLKDGEVRPERRACSRTMGVHLSTERCHMADRAFGADTGCLAVQLPLCPGLCWQHPSSCPQGSWFIPSLPDSGAHMAHLLLQIFLASCPTSPPPPPPPRGDPRGLLHQPQRRAGQSSSSAASSGRRPRLPLA